MYLNFSDADTLAAVQSESKLSSSSDTSTVLTNCTNPVHSCMHFLIMMPWQSSKISSESWQPGNVRDCSVAAIIINLKMLASVQYNIITDRFCMTLVSALKKVHCTHVTCDSKWVTVSFYGMLF